MQQNLNQVRPNHSGFPRTTQAPVNRTDDNLTRELHPLEEELFIDLPGLAGEGISIRLLLHAMADAITCVQARILSEVLPKIEHHYDLVALYEAVHFADRIRLWDSEGSGAKLQILGLSSFPTIPLRQCADEIAGALHVNSEILLDLLYTNGDDPEGDLRLAEAIAIAETIVQHHGTEVPNEGDSGRSRALNLAWEARTHWILRAVQPGAYDRLKKPERLKTGLNAANFELMHNASFLALRGQAQPSAARAGNSRTLRNNRRGRGPRAKQDLPLTPRKTKAPTISQTKN